MSAVMYYDLGLHKLVNKECAKRKYQLCWKSKDLKTVYYVGAKEQPKLIRCIKLMFFTRKMNY